MDFSAITIERVQNVLSALQKNLECPICLDVVQEPVSTKCDHIFCRFCMFKLLSKKKKGVVQCPLCKSEVTKRSLKENAQFKTLAEGLLETVHAFELDTGLKFLKGHHFPKTSTEATAAEFLCKERSVIQSKGFRNRRKNAPENGQENCTLEEAPGNIQLTDNRVKRYHLRNKPQKCDSQKGIYVELGSESSEEFFQEPSKTGFEDKAAVQISSQEELESGEKGNENPCSAQPEKLCAKEIMLPNVIGESDISKEGLREKGTQSIAGCAKPDQVNRTECPGSPLDVLAVDLLPEQCDRIGNASPTVSRDTFLKDTEEMDEEQTQYNIKSKEFDLRDSSESRLDENKEMDTVVQSVEAAEVYEAENDPFYGKELPLEKPLQPETLHTATLNQVSRKRLKQSIKKVNEWFSKSNKTLSSDSSLDDSAGATDASGEGDVCSSDKESCISEKTDPVAASMDIAEVEGNSRWSKPRADSIKDKIFGKTYKRERKSNPPSTLRDVLPHCTGKKEDVAADKCLNNSSKDRLKRKRKTAYVLQPEDFIKKKDTEEVDRGPQNVASCLGDAEMKRCDDSVAVGENHLSQVPVDNAVAELEEGGKSTWQKATGKVASKHCDGELEMCNSGQKNTRRSSTAKRCRRSTRTRCALQLVVGRNSASPDPAEPQIESYPSSGEPRNVDSEQNQVRRSRRLQLLSEEMSKETRKVVKGARKKDSDCGGSVLGDQRNVATPTAECKDLCEPQDMPSYKTITNLKGSDLEANERQVSLKCLSDTAETGKSPFNPVPSGQHANCSSFAAHAGSPVSESQGNPGLQSPSVPAVQAASHQAEEMTESPTGCGDDSQSIPGDSRTEKLPIAKNVLELAKEAEDSELDTQYLRNIFRHSKRSSFSLYQNPRFPCAVQEPDSEMLNPSHVTQVGSEHGKDLQSENLKEEKTPAESLSRVCEKEKPETCESASVGHVTCPVISTGEHIDAGSQSAEEGILTPVGTGTAGTEGENRSQKGEQGNEKPVSTDIGMESGLRQSSTKSSRNQSNQSNTEDHDSKQIDLNTGCEIGFGSESNLAGKTQVVDGKGPILHFQSRSITCPATCQQSPAEFSCEVIRKNNKGERKRVKRDEEQATQTAATAVPECSVAETPEEPLGGNSDFTGLSETPDGLLCSDADIEENTSFCESDRREQSAVFVKSDNALGKELHNRNHGSQARSQGVQRSRRRAQKLPSSDEESSEAEELPCFQTLICGKSVSTPLQVHKKVTAGIESSASPSMSPHGGSKDANVVQEMPEAALGNVCMSPSQESECSVNLFSSQSMSEESVNGPQELNQPLVQVAAPKQVSSVKGSKETFPSCDGGPKIIEVGFRDECQEDPNMGAKLGEASGYDSETSIVEDSCEPFSQGEILTTQQKDAMQNSLKKLQQEMAVLEAVLKQHGGQDCDCLPVHRGRTHGMEQMRQEKERSPELLLPSSESCLLKRPDLEKGLECDSVVKNKAPSAKTQPVQEAGPEHRQCQPEAGATNGSVETQSTNKSCDPGHKLKRSACFPVPVLPKAAGKENAASSVVTKRKEMSIVASGLNHSEHLVVQKFVRKTQSTLSNHITEGTTHVIMKTDEELVCERTLKYFLGIAGGKWVVSYQWIIQSFKEGRILDEEEFEVRGDVINGRNHQGPRRARQALTAKIFKDFEICCYGPFTDMTTEHLEWMVELCGASVVKQLHLFTHTSNSTPVVVVQPDAWKENTDYRALQQQNSPVVTREWVLDSVASYECQRVDAYLVS